MDEIFDSSNNICGHSNNHIATIIWQKKYAPQNDAKFFSDVHDFILVYAKDKKKAHINRIERNNIQNDRYKNIDNDPRGPWTSSDLTVKTPNSECLYPIYSPSGKVFTPSQSRSWGINEEKFKELVEDNRIWFGSKENSMPRLKRFLSEVSNGIVPKTIWNRDEVGDNSEGKKEIKRLFNSTDNIFTTPKPERLLQRIISISTNEGDWVLDAFLGSGTTCAVAQKLNRKWIGLENGDQMNSICIPRLEKEIQGLDNGGITKDIKWNGGGGFNYYEIES